MIPGFEKIVEDRIKKAQEDGHFENLDGSFKPIEFEKFNGPEEFRLGHKILKNAGFLPPEVELRKEIYQTEQLLETLSDDQPRTLKVEKRLRYLLTKLDSVRQSHSGVSLLDQQYGKAIKNKLS